MTDSAAAPVRDEDAFDVARMHEWLQAHAGPAYRSDLLPEVRQFAGGASNLTYLLRYPNGSESDSGAQPIPELVLRRPPAGTKARGAHDIGREYRIQAAIADAFDLVPTMVAHCADPEVLGSEFYVMERVQGVIPRRDLPPELGLTPAQTGELCRHVVDVLVRLHSIDVEVAGLGWLGKGQGYVARQVDGWITRMHGAATEDLGDWTGIEAWLRDHQPDDVATCLIHNDFRLDNLVLDRDDPLRVVGVLDWEMATLGDPLMDLGSALAYWVEAGDDEVFQQFRRQPSSAPGMWTRDEIVAYYCQQMGFTLTPGQWLFYEVFGLYRVAVIAQQIWYRFVHGQTSNPAYGVFGAAVGYLEQRCRSRVG